MRKTKFPVLIISKSITKLIAMFAHEPFEYAYMYSRCSEIGFKHSIYSLYILTKFKNGIYARLQCNLYRAEMQQHSICVLFIFIPIALLDFNSKTTCWVVVKKK